MNSPGGGDPGTDARVEQYVTFTIGERLFGIGILSVREIRQWAQPTPLPHQPEWNRGVLNLRGAIVPVNDLRARLGGGRTDPTPGHVVVITSIAGQSVGILVDAVSDIVTVRAEQVQALPPNAGAAEHSAIGGLVDDSGGMVALLDLDRLFPCAAQQPVQCTTSKKA